METRQALSHLPPGDTIDVCDRTFALRHHGDDVGTTGPTGMRLWPCSLLAAEQVLTQAAGANRTFLDLACGTGLVGIVAAAKGYRVTFLDVEPRCIELARGNATANGYGDAEFLCCDWSAVTGRTWDCVVTADTALGGPGHAASLAAAMASTWSGSDDGFCWLCEPRRGGLEPWHEAMISLGRWTWRAGLEPLGWLADIWHVEIGIKG